MWERVRRVAASIMADMEYMLENAQRAWADE